MSKIRIAIAGVGNCASSLIQGIQWYKNNPTQKVGLTYEMIGDYDLSSLEFVLGFDVDSRKVLHTLNEAIFAAPNNCMNVVEKSSETFKGTIAPNSYVYRGPTLDGIASHMRNLPAEVTFVEKKSVAEISKTEYQNILVENKIDVLLNYVPVGANEAAKFYVENALSAGINVVNCMPTYISTKDAMMLEQMAIDNGVTIIGSDMRSQFGASRLSEILQGNMIDSGLLVTQHIQTNMASGSTQGQEHIMTGRTANTDFLNMAEKYRLVNKHISKENVLKGQNKVRDISTAGMTLFAGPSLTVMQTPGENVQYIPTDNKICNIDMIAYGWAGARYELTARLSVQDSPNSAGIVLDAVRFCATASDLGIVGYIRGASAWTQKTPPLQMKTSDAKFECDALARKIITPLMEKQFKVNNPSAENLEYTFQKSETDY